MTGFGIRPRKGPGDHVWIEASLLQFVWTMSGRHQFAVCLIAAAVAVASMVPLELQRRIVNSAIGQSDLQLLLTLVGGYFGVLLVLAALKYFLRMYQSWLSQSATLNCREHLALVHERRADDANGGERGRAVSVIGTEVDHLGQFVGEGFSEPVVNAGMLVAIASYMLIVEPKIAVFSLLFLIPQILIVPWLQDRINRRAERSVEIVREMSDGIAELPHQRQAVARSLLPRTFDEMYDNKMWTWLLKTTQLALVNLLNSLAPLSVLCIGGYFAIQGETSLGILVAFISGFDRLSAPLKDLIAYYRVAAQAYVQHKLIISWIGDE